MIIISHRGLTQGSSFTNRDNDPELIEKVLTETNYEVEIDLRYCDDKLYLGHDYPQYFITLEWLFKNKNRLWIHCKDVHSSLLMSYLNLNENTGYKYFCHSSDNCVCTSSGHLWLHEPYYYITKNINNCIIPLIQKIDVDKFLQFYSTSSKLFPYAICTDYTDYFVNEIYRIMAKNPSNFFNLSPIKLGNLQVLEEG